MIKLILAAFVMTLAAFAWGAQPASVWNFDGDEAGKLAKGFTNECGDWKVAKDDTAPSKPNVFAQTAKGPKAQFNVTLAAESSFKDVDLSVKMKAVAGEIDQGGGLVWRAKDGANYYLTRFNPLEDNFRVYKVVAGVRKQLGSVELKAAPGWHTLRAVMSGAHIACYFDGAKLLEADDSTFTDGGKVGLWTKADAQTHFDDLTASEAK
jgi:hypothetical protein